MKPKSPTAVRYWIDAHDCIIQVNDDWLRFAEENDGGRLIPSLILGRSLWSFIADPTLGELYRHLIDVARLGKTVRFNYRCDAPTVRRLFEMQIIGGDHGVVELASTLLDVCSWCQRIAVEGHWLSVEAGVEALGLMRQLSLPALTHGICKECQDKMMDVIAERRSAAEN